jgi:hypothetical protein
VVDPAAERLRLSGDLSSGTTPVPALHQTQDMPEPPIKPARDSRCRRRSLAWIHLQVHQDRVVFTLINDQVARIEPAHGAELDELRGWDAFQLELTPEEEQALEELREDSWWGRYS